MKPKKSIEKEKGFNTSYVSVQGVRIDIKGPGNEFQYILCVGSR